MHYEGCFWGVLVSLRTRCIVKVRAMQRELLRAEHTLMREKAQLMDLAIGLEALLRRSGDPTTAAVQELLATVLASEPRWPQMGFSNCPLCSLWNKKARAAICHKFLLEGPWECIQHGEGVCRYDHPDVDHDRFLKRLANRDKLEKLAEFLGDEEQVCGAALKVLLECPLGLQSLVHSTCPEVSQMVLDKLWGTLENDRVRLQPLWDEWARVTPWIEMALVDTGIFTHAPASNPIAVPSSRVAGSSPPNGASGGHDRGFN